MEENKTITKKKILKNNILLYLFIFEILLLFAEQLIYYINNTIRAGQTDGGFSGWFIFLVPMLVIVNTFISRIPQLIGLILCKVNNKKKNILISIFIFILSLISIFTINFPYIILEFEYNLIIVILSLICNIILNIISLKEIIKESKKITMNKVSIIIYSICMFTIMIYINFIYLILLPNFILGNKITNLIISIALLLIIWISFILWSILEIIHIRKVTEKNVKKNIITSIIIFFVLGILLCIMPFTLNKLIKNIYKNQAASTINPLIKKVKKDEENKLVYLMNDLQNLENYKLDSFSDTSYITYYDETIYVCFTNGKYNITGDEKELKITEVDKINKPCNYDFKSSEGEKYLKQYLSKKYNIEIISVNAVIEPSSLFSLSHIDHYDIKTRNITFEANVKMNDGQIIVTDTYQENINNLTTDEINTANLLTEIEKFTKTYLNVEQITNDTEIYDIHKLDSNSDIIVIGASYNQEDAKKYANALGNNLIQSNNNAKIMIRRLIENNKNIEHEYVIYITIKNGILNIETQ